MEFVRLPFLIPGMYGGAARLEGFVSLTQDGLVFEYRLSDTLVGVFSGGVKTCTIPFTELEIASSGPGLFFTPWLEIVARKMTTFERFPTKEPAHLKLRVRWRHRPQLRALTSELNLQLSYLEADRYRSRLTSQTT